MSKLVRMSSFSEAPPSYEQVMRENFRRNRCQSVQSGMVELNYFSRTNLPQVPDLSRNHAMKLLIELLHKRGMKSLAKENFSISQIHKSSVIRMTRTTYFREKKIVRETKQISDEREDGVIKEELIKCQRCDGIGKNLCSNCHGSLFKVCVNCQGDGIEYYVCDNASQTTNCCLYCSGTGKINCQFCNMLPSTECKVCGGKGKLRQCDILKTLVQKKHRYHYDCDERSSQVLEESVGIPLPGRTKTLLENTRHLSKFIKEVVKVDMIPVYDVTLTHAVSSTHKFWIYGLNHTVYFPQLSNIKSTSSSCSIM